MAPLQSRTTTDVTARCRRDQAAGLSARRRRRGPKGPKEGSRRPGAPPPLERSQPWTDTAPSYRQRIDCAALRQVRRPVPAWRALRAFKVVERVLTTSSLTWPHLAHGTACQAHRLTGPPAGTRLPAIAYPPW